MELYYLFVGLMICLITFTVLSMLLRSNKEKKKLQKFVKENSDAIRLYTSKTSASASIAGDFLELRHNLFIEKVNGEYPNNRFSEKLAGLSGVYIKPGKNIITVMAHSPSNKKRVGNHSYGPAELVLDAQEGKDYQIIFNDKEFKIEEV